LWEEIISTQVRKVSVIILLVYVLVGIVIFLRESDDRLALLASISPVLFPVSFSTQIVLDANSFVVARPRPLARVRGRNPPVPIPESDHGLSRLAPNSRGKAFHPDAGA